MRAGATTTTDGGNAATDREGGSRRQQPLTGRVELWLETATPGADQSRSFDTNQPSAGPADRACARPRSTRSRRNPPPCHPPSPTSARSEEHTSELQSLMRLSYAVICLKKKNNDNLTSSTQ